MNTFIIILVILFFGLLALVSFGMTIGKKDMEDFEYLSAYVDRCPGSSWDKTVILEEYHRLLDGGRIPTELMGWLRKKIMKKFK